MTGPLRDDRDMNNAVRSWLTESQEPTADRGRQIGRIMGRVDEVRQRRRMWPLNPFGRRAAGHEATGAEVTILPAHGRTATLTSVRAMAALAITVLVTVSIIWVASRPLEQRIAPGAGAVDPADQALFERFVTLWADEQSDLAGTQQVYAEDAVHRVLWLDEEEVISGSSAIWRRLQRSPGVDRPSAQPIRLEDHFSGARRYLLISDPLGETSLAGTACVLWVEDEGIARHDCIMPVPIEREDWPTMVAPDPSTSAEGEALVAAFSAAVKAYDRAAFDELVSPAVTHHVLSANQSYTLEGLDEYWSVMSLGGPAVAMNVALPAPEGEVRWANFSSIGTGSLCVFWAQDGLITRHDCIMPSRSTVRVSSSEDASPSEG